MSKANQAFKQNDEAVSPVIGVILMVAITVVLAAVVFVLVSNLGGDSNTAPAISWNKNESQDTLSVVTASSNADWSNLEIMCSSTTVLTVTLNLNGAEADASTLDCVDATNEAAPVSDTSAAIRAGDDLEFICATGADGSIDITITDPSANQIVKEETFTVDCA
jgi:flagellin-like protein